MDESCVPFFSYGPEGCNYCVDSKTRAPQVSSINNLETSINEIKARSNGKYDCVVGVSGGLDSSFLLAKIVDLGLRPIAVHMDNNWNSSMASRNIKRILEALNVPLITEVTDWDTQKNLQLAFLNADVVDIELLYDNALHSVCYGVARKLNIKTVIGGSNNATEGVEVPSSWGWKKFDGKNIRAIARANSIAVKKYPIFSSLEWLYCTLVLRIKWISLLDQIPEYSRASALSYLADRFNYTDYGSKHFENVFTRFYQGYILPNKFGIDKRKPHLSSEIVSGAISREFALGELAKPIYSSEALFRLDYRYVCDKLGISDFEMQEYITRPKKPHSDFGQDWLLQVFIPVLLRIRRRILILIRK